MQKVPTITEEELDRDKLNKSQDSKDDSVVTVEEDKKTLKVPRVKA
mgnify:CR=1 FL=1